MAEAIFSTPIQNSVQKQLDSTLAAGATSVVLSEDVSALFTGTDATHPCVCVIDRIDSNGNLTPTKREYIKFTGVSTTTLTGCTRNADSSGSDQEHAVGAIVEFVPDVLWAKSLQDNYVDTSTAQTLALKTLTTPVIASMYQDAGKTKLLTVPDTASDTLVATAATQTLTNKTLTSPKINENVALTASATELNLLDGVAEVADVTNRQGGSATEWATAGTSNYTESDVLIQSGSVAVTIASGADNGSSTEVTFPVAFAGTPLVFCTVDDISLFTTFNETPFLVVGANFPTTTKVQFTAITRSGNVAGNRTFAIHWLAIGKKST
jgi:hypothetical protein